MRYTFLLYSDPAMAANMTEEDWAKSKEIYGQYIGALQEAGCRYRHDGHTGRRRKKGSGRAVRRDERDAGRLLCNRCREP